MPQGLRSTKTGHFQEVVKRSAAMGQFKKTEMCRFARMGCKHGSACNFAHSLDDVSSRPDLSKTSVCRLWRSGRCPHDATQCKFAHGRCELRATAKYYVLKEEMHTRSALQPHPHQHPEHQQQRWDQQAQCHQDACWEQPPALHGRQVDLQALVTAHDNDGRSPLCKHALQVDQLETDCGSDSGATTNSLEDNGANFSRVSSLTTDSNVTANLVIVLHSGIRTVPDVRVIFPLPSFYERLSDPSTWSGAAVARLLAEAAPELYED